MGNKIDISTLGKFKTYAEQADANRNNYLEDSEVSVFKSKITKEEISKNSITRTDLGLLVTNSVMTQEEVDGLMSDSYQPTKIEKSNYQVVMETISGYFINEDTRITIGETEEGKSYKQRNEITGVVDYLKKYHTGNPEQILAIKEVEQLEMIIKNSGLDLTTQKGIEELDSNKFARQNNLTKFQKRALGYYVLSYMQQAVSKNAEEVQKIYNAEIEKLKNQSGNQDSTPKISYHNVLENVKKELKNSGKWKQEYYQDAYNLIEDSCKKAASIDFLENLRNETGTDLSTKSLIKKYAADDELKAQIIKGSKSLIELTNRRNKAKENIKNSKFWSNEQIKKQLGSLLYSKLTRESNDVDLEKIGNLIMECVGQDYNVNYNTTVDAEIENIRTKLAENGLTLDNDKQVKQLLDFYGIPYEGKYDMKKLPLALAYVAGGAVVNAGLSVATNQAFKNKINKLYSPGEYTITYQDHDVQYIDLTNKLRQALENGNITINGQTVTGTIDGTLIVEVTIDKFIDFVVKNPDIMGSDAIKDLLKTSTFASGIVGALLSLPYALKIMERPNESNCFPKYPINNMQDNMLLSDYVENIKIAYSADEDAQNFYITLAKMCSYEIEEDGKKVKRIDKDEVEKVLNWAAGTGSPLNCEEASGLRLFNDGENDLTIEPKPDCPPCPDCPTDDVEEDVNENGDGSSVNLEITPFEEKHCEKVEVKTYDMRKSSWDKMVSAYGDCLLEKCGNNRYVAGRVLKVIQGIDPELYGDIDKLVEIAKYSMKNGLSATRNKYGDDFADFGRFEHYIKTPDLNNIILPDNINGCAKNQDFNYRAVRTNNPYHGSNYGVYNGVIQKDSKTSTYGYTDTQGNKKTFATKAERDAAIEAERQKNNKIKVNDEQIQDC